MQELIKLLESDKNFKKTHKAFLEMLYNKNGYLLTDKSRMIEAAYIFDEKGQLNLSIERQDYSSNYLIQIKE